jgi:hypothetical protein
MNHYVKLGVLSLAGVFLGGCSFRPPVSEVEGTLTWNGTPLSGITVQFTPDGDEGTSGPSSTGTTDSEGHFTLICDDNRRGAAVGHHRVVLQDSGDPGEVARQRDPRQRSAGQNTQGSGAPGKLPAIPVRYKSPATTPLRREVGAGKQTIDLKLP